MKKHVIPKLFCALAALQGISAAVPAGSLLRVTVDRDAIYTPGNMRFSLALTPSARLAGPYDLRITVYTVGNKVREHTMTVMRGSPVTYEVSFPRVHETTRGSYRVELPLGGEQLEAQEGPISLWPPRDVRPVTRSDAEVWVLDTSGMLQALLPQFGIKPTDAAFQTVRDFGRPDIVFAGEYLDGMNMQALTERIAATSQPLVVILLRQKQWPQELEATIGKKADLCCPVIPQPNSPLLKDLTGGDLLRLLRNANATEIEPYVDRSIHSHLTAVTEDAGTTLSYLCVVQEAGRTTLLCQLPAVNRDDPRQMTLLRNIVQFACRNVDRADPNEQTRVERGKP